MATDDLVFETALKAFDVMTASEKEQVLTTLIFNGVRAGLMGRDASVTVKQAFAHAVHQWVKTGQ